MQPMYPPSTADARALRLGDLLAAGGALLVFVFSFTPFIEVSVPEFSDVGEASGWQNAWATETFMAPLTWFVVLAGLLLIGAAAVRYLRGQDPQLIGFRLTQVEVGLALFMLVVLFSMVTSDKHVIFGRVGRQLGEGAARLEVSWGAILMLIGALIATVGAVLTHLGVGPVIVPQRAQPQAQAGPAGHSYGPPPGQPYPPPPPAGQPYAPPPGQTQPPGPGITPEPGAPPPQTPPQQ